MFILRLDGTQLYYSDESGYVELKHRSHAAKFTLKADALIAAGMAPFVVEEEESNDKRKRKVRSPKSKA